MAEVGQGLPEKRPERARMTVAERGKKVEKAAADFAVRFEQVTSGWERM